MKIFGHPVSTCTRKVLTTLAETGTSYEFVLVDFAKGEHKQEPFITRQPFGQVPALEDDDGYQLYESRAICRYINDKVGGKLIPGDAQNRGRMEQWISIETSNFTPHAMKFIYQHVFKRDQEPGVLEAAGAALDKTLAILDAHLAGKEFIAGDFSIADISFMPYLDYLMATPARDRVLAHANVAAWWTRISERPSWQRVTGRSSAA